MELASYKTSKEYDLLVGCWPCGSKFILWMLPLIYFWTWYNVVFLPTLTVWLHHQSPLFRIVLVKSVFTQRMWEWWLSRRVSFWCLCFVQTNLQMCTALQCRLLLYLTILLGIEGHNVMVTYWSLTDVSRCPKGRKFEHWFCNYGDILVCFLSRKVLQN